MRKIVAAAVLAALIACGGRSSDQYIQTVTIYQPNDTHFVRTIRYDARTHRIVILNVGEPPAFATPKRPLPLPPIDALRWVAKNGGFNQPIQTTQASEIVGIRVTFSNAPPLQTRFASAWDVDEPSQLKTVQSWYENVVYRADVASKGTWKHTLAYAVSHRRIRQIRFMPGRYTLVIDRNGTAHIAVGHGKHLEYASGTFDRRELGPIYTAALGLSPRAPVYLANDPPTRVVIIADHRTFAAVGSNDAALQIFAARMDQLARDIHWSRIVTI